MGKSWDANQCYGDLKSQTRTRTWDFLNDTDATEKVRNPRPQNINKSTALMPSQTGSYWCTRGHQFSLHTPQGTATTSGHPQNHLHLQAPGPRLHEDDDMISESRLLLLDHESPGVVEASPHRGTSLHPPTGNRHTSGHPPQTTFKFSPPGNQPPLPPTGNPRFTR